MHVPNKYFSQSWMWLTCGPVLFSCISIFSLPIAQLLVYSNRSRVAVCQPLFCEWCWTVPHPAVYSLGLLDDLLWAFDKLVVDGVRLAPSGGEFSN